MLVIKTELEFDMNIFNFLKRKKKHNDYMSSWGDMKLNDFFQYQKIMKMDLENEHTVMLHLINFVTKKPMKELKNMTTEDFNRFVQGVDISWLQNNPKTYKKPIKRLKLDGKDYYINTEYFQLTTAQFIDLNTIFKKDDNMLDVLCCVIIPKGSKYNDESYDLNELRDIILNNISVEETFSIVNFMLRSYTKLLGLLSQYLEKQLVKTLTDKEMRELLNKEWKRIHKEGMKHIRGF